MPKAFETADLKTFLVVHDRPVTPVLRNKKVREKARGFLSPYRLLCG
jgi:hypothetical protein